jgi:recombination protein RecA
MPSVAALRAQIESSLGEHLSSTLLLRERAAPLTVATGVAVLDALTGGLPRGALSEIVGSASSGRTGVMLATLAEATLRREMCALVDASDSFDPVSATAAGLDLNRLLWVRCSQHSNLYSHKPRAALGRLEQVLKVTDLLLQAGGFGMVVLDLGDIPVESARRVPLTSWFRFRRAVEPTATVLLLIEQEPCAKTCASLVVRLECKSVCAHDSVATHARIGTKDWQILARDDSGIPENTLVSHAALLRGMQLQAEVVRSSLPSSTLNGNPDSGTRRKPAQPANATFELQAGW